MEIDLDDTYDIGPESPQPIDETIQTQQGLRDPVREDVGVGQGVTGENEAVQEANDKPKRAVPKPVFDSKRLLSDVGLPKLRKTLLKTTFNNKAAPRKDLQKLATIYKLWAHRLLPRSNVEDTAALLLRAGENYDVKLYRKNLVDEDKYGALDAQQERETVQTAQTQPVQLESERAQTEPAQNVTQLAEPQIGTKRAGRDPKTTDISAIEFSDSDSEIPNDAQLREMAQVEQATQNENDEWDVYRELGF